MNVAYNMDCLEAMKEMKDNEFDLAIVDPPYGINISKAKSKTSYSLRKDRKNKSIVSRNQYKGKNWDNEIPTKEYFNELFRVSKNQIIWGGNYFELPSTKGIIVWDKCNLLDNYSDGELAWTSFKKPLKIIPLIHDGFKRGLRIGRDSKIKYNEPYTGKQDIHPTQKPVALYKWLLTNYAKQGDKILDTHLGSGSSRIACYDLGFDFTGYELDKEYYELQEKRFERHVNQTSIFEVKE